jgi:zinc protease
MIAYRPLAVFAALAALLAPCNGAYAKTKTEAAPVAPPPIEIPFQRFVLDNGLTLIVHEDHKAPIVAVNVWYHVGSKNEKPGRTGFAHLFEHLMFNGSEHFNDDYFKATEKVGATDQNGTTNEDRTNYFQNVPVSALDTILWLESDRMGHLVGAIDQAKLDEQRGVVQNEKRQRENQPYGQVEEVIVQNTYPAAHPYSWTVIGSMEDLNAAKLDDVHDWFKSRYGAQNAVIVIAGDISPEVAHKKVEQYFGDIPAGPPITRQRTWIAKMTGAHRSVMQDRVPQARLYKVWNVPEWGSADETDLSMVSDVLASGKTSRLYKRLVYDMQIATDVNAYVDARELSSQFFIQATAQPGADLAAIEKAIDEELARLLRDGPTPDELSRTKTNVRAGFIRGIERIGGFGGKSDVLASNQVFAGDAAHYKATLDRVASATTDRLRRAANTWLADGVFTLEVHPFPPYKTSASTVDRKNMPAVPDAPEPAFPKIRTATLSNGLKVALAERPAVPLVSMRLIVDAGYAGDQGRPLGTASLAMSMLDEGTATRNALAISDELERLGARFSAGSTVDGSTATISALKENLAPSLSLFADLVLHPAFPAADFERLRKQQLAAIQREKVTPFPMALRVLPSLLYGPGHAYSVPFTGSGTEDSVRKISRDDLVRFHHDYFKPNNATLVVVGATTLAEVTPLLEQQFAAWAKGDVPAKNIGEPTAQKTASVYLIDRPGSQQSIVLAGELAPPKRTPDDVAIQAMNSIIGGTFTSRLNMNLREDKHWSYGARTLVYDARGPRMFLAYAAVQSDKTSESIQEAKKELTGLTGERPVSADELTKTRELMTRTLPGRWETIGAVQGSIDEILEFGLPLDYYETYATAVRALDVPQVVAASKKVVQPDRLVWVIVGDRQKIEPGIRALGLGTIEIIDADGKPVAQP